MTALIVGYARTPFTKFTGQLADQPATALGAHAVSAALARAGITPDQVDQVIVGQVLQAGAGQNPARQTAVAAGIPMTVPAISVNAVCLSGTEAVSHAARIINSGDADIVVAVGQESMSLAPHVIGLRAGTKYGSASMRDTIEFDGLTDAYDQIAMGALTDRGNAGLGLTREAQDAFAAESHQRSAASAGFLQGEIAPYTLHTRHGDVVVSSDDGVRADTTIDKLSTLRAAFEKDGSITAGNASQITDGAAALVLVSERAAQRLSLKPLASVEATAFVAGPDNQLHSQPSRAIAAALAKLPGDVTAGQLAAVEINEAFAAVVLQSISDLGLDPALVNQHGGAIALGHPIGASGARIVGTLARQLAAVGPGSLGATGICGGGGQGSAVVLRSM